MCQRLNTGESNNFYFGIFICIRPLSVSQLTFLYRTTLKSGPDFNAVRYMAYSHENGAQGILKDKTIDNGNPTFI